MVDDIHFDGFTDEAHDFYVQLAANNNREFFAAHREIYERAVRRPIEALLAEAEATYGPGRVMRPNRDVRFSKDKTPYRLGASMWAGTVGGIYLSAGLEGIETGGGVYGPSRDQLQRARQAIDARPLASRRMAEVIATLESEGFEMAGPSLTTSPKGYDRDNPNIELLRLRHYAATTQLPFDASPDSIRDAWKRVEPLIAWTDEFIGAALSWP